MKEKLKEVDNDGNCRFRFYFGKNNNWRRCGWCGGVIKKNTSLVKVQKFGEYPDYFHIKCAKTLKELLNKTIDEAFLMLCL